MTYTDRNPPHWRHSICLLAAAFLLAGCFWPAEAEEEPLSFTLPSTFSDVPLAVGSQSVLVERGDVVRTLAFDGTVQAGTQRELYFEVDGRVTVVHVAGGDHVETDQLLVTLDDEEAQQQLAAVQLRRQQAELRVAQVLVAEDYGLEIARLNLEIAELRLEKVRWDPNTSPEDIQVAERQVDLARTEVQRAEADQQNQSLEVTVAQVQLQLADIELVAAQRHLSRLQLRAPISGTIRLTQELRPGLAVDAFQPLARMIDPGSLVIESNLASTDQALLAEGMPVSIETGIGIGSSLTGSIGVLPQPYGSGVTPITRIVPESPQAQTVLREGMLVTLRAEAGRREDVLWVPNRVIQTIGGQTYVVVREGDTLRDQQVTVGLVGDERSEILSGLSEGMTVVGP